jgi:hypothetical protein
METRMADNARDIYIVGLRNQHAVENQAVELLCRQDGANGMLLHIPKKRLNGVVAAHLPSGLVNETGGICGAGVAHG